MAEHAAFERAIIQNPNEDTPRLAYADYLQDNPRERDPDADNEYAEGLRSVWGEQIVPMYARFVLKDLTRWGLLLDDDFISHDLMGIVIGYNRLCASCETQVNRFKKQRLRKKRFEEYCQEPIKGYEDVLWRLFKYRTCRGEILSMEVVAVPSYMEVPGSAVGEDFINVDPERVRQDLERYANGLSRYLFPTGITYQRALQIVSYGPEDQSWEERYVIDPDRSRVREPNPIWLNNQIKLK